MIYLDCEEVLMHDPKLDPRGGMSCLCDVIFATESIIDLFLIVYFLLDFVSIMRGNLIQS
uniref:Uncharacterized protein n=1 Tax=Triticum urartu TaxID=4572 RepID=A0A8R7Q1F4_TRIUA